MCPNWTNPGSIWSKGSQSGQSGHIGYPEMGPFWGRIRDPLTAKYPTRGTMSGSDRVWDPSKGVSKGDPILDPYSGPLRTSPDGMCGSKGPCQQHIRFVPFGPKYPVPFGTGFGVKFGAIWSPWVPTHGGWIPGFRDLTYIADP